jgi:hypothetical protein
MFSQELLVVIEEPGRGEFASMFVDARLVRMEGRPERGHPICGELAVEAETQGDRATVFLPVQSSACGRVISVPAEFIAG